MTSSLTKLIKFRIGWGHLPSFSEKFWSRKVFIQTRVCYLIFWMMFSVQVLLTIQPPWKMSKEIMWPELVLIHAKEILAVPLFVILMVLWPLLVLYQRVKCAIKKDFQEFILTFKLSEPGSTRVSSNEYHIAQLYSQIFPLLIFFFLRKGFHLVRVGFM